MSDKLQFRHYALVGIMVTGFLSIPWQLYERRHEIRAIVQRIILPAPANRSEPSPYLSAPGNRTSCDSAGWIATQSDGSRNPWRVKCTRSTRA